MKKPDLSVIILNYNTKQRTMNCLKSVFEHTEGVNYEVIVVDNASTDGSVEKIQNSKWTRSDSKIQNDRSKFKIIRNEKNLGFAGGNNIGIKKARGRYILLLNSDTYLSENSLGKMVKIMDNHPDIGITSCRLKNVDRTTQATGGFFPTLPRVFAWMFFLDDIPFVSRLVKSVHPPASSMLYKKDHELDWITGAFFMIRQEVIDNIGLLDEDFFMYVEDLEYCYRAKKKSWKIFYTTATDITHIGGASGAFGNTIIRELENLKLFYRKHRSVWEEKVLVFLLKIGVLLRIFVFGILYIVEEIFSRRKNLLFRVHEKQTRLCNRKEKLAAYEKAYSTL